MPIVRVFYANTPERKNSRVFLGGKFIELTPRKINRFYNIPGIPEGSCEYQNKLEKCDLGEIIEKLCPHNSHRRKWNISKDQPLSFETRDLERYAKQWFYFVISRLLPIENTNRLTRDRAILMFCILEGESIDVRHIILQNIICYMIYHKTDYLSQC